MIKLHTHLKRMVVKAHTMQWSIEKVHKRMDEILIKYGVKNKLPCGQPSKPQEGK